LHAQIGEDGLYTIDCDLSHYDEQAEVYLEDLFTGTVTNLKIKAKYDFSAKKSDHTNRFLIHLLPYGEIYKQQTGLDEDATDEEYLIYSNEKDIYIRTGLNAEIHDIVLFDLFGKEVYRSEVSNTHLIKMSPNLASGVYIIRINTGKRMISQKLNLL
ncbi:MAG: T9SS type A sorting domain-containing protein, partial [Bacteroidetes bacterium]|nr:T9SS type A sorting domain-containing protein [Bacteroidota bacterium]MBT6835196.1 T9SS type A sorting domain-containing protein [Bacteroidota bacterium]